MKSIYISGPITGNPGYRAKFAAAEAYLSAKGYAVLNPAILPSGLPNRAYMPICLAMLNAADAIVLLKGWHQSQGAGIEYCFADYQNKPIYQSLEEVPGQTGGAPT